MNGINRYLRASAVLVIVSTGAVPASYGESFKLEVLLSDAQYALNRYQELDTSAVCDALHMPKHMRETGCKRVQRVVGDDVERIKAVVLRASKAPNPSATDLLDIYDQLEEVSSRLNDIGNNVGDLTDHPEQGLRYTEAATKTLVLAEKFYVVLRERINALEKVCAR